MISPKNQSTDHTVQYNGKEPASGKITVPKVDEAALVPAKSEPKSTPKWADYNRALDKLGYKFRMNDLDDTLECNGRRMSDGLEAEIMMRMNDIGFTTADRIKRAYTATAHTNRYNPITDFLNSLEWDGTDQIAKFERYVWDSHPKIEYPNGSIIPVFGAWLRRFGIGAVAKAMKTGSVRGQNFVIVLSGGQDIGKSTLARFLCPMPDEYFIESHVDPDSNDHVRYLATRLCWEIAELGATTRRSDVEALKSFLTRQDATFRPPYAHHPVTKPAITSFIGTINPETGFLRDVTGNRRFLPVNIKKIDHAYINEIDPKQLWAQFVALYKADEPWRLTPEETKIADAIRGEHEVEDAYTGFVAKYYDIDPTQTGWQETTAEIVEQLQINGVDGANVTNIGLSLKRLGLERQRTPDRKRTYWTGIKRNNIGDLKRR